MTRILIVGYDPDVLDFSDPGPPQGLDRDKVRAGAAESLRRIEKHGWQADQCLVPPDDTAPGAVEAALRSASYDCVVIGGGVRMAQNSVPVFERILDTIRRNAPDVPVAFNEGPDRSLEAAKRWLGRAA